MIEKLMDNNVEIRFIPDGMTAFERNTKRIFDCLIAFVAMILLSPVLVYCYLVVKLEDGGPAIFKQERIGRFGRPFTIYKFRSMRLDAEKEKPALLQDGARDPRLTKIGRFLRKHHLDELPQLWNVFIGDMAFVGPRPERAYYIKLIEKEDPRYYMLYQIRPGVTSYATLYNGYTDTMEKMLIRLQYDLDYLEHRSWSLDVTILLKTFLYIICGKIF
jgi:lipopolysaccharide/colanic/teichoic acid biosynthesis glycosyltransferase